MRKVKLALDLIKRLGFLGFCKELLSYCNRLIIRANKPKSARLVKTVKFYNNKLKLALNLNNGEVDKKIYLFGLYEPRILETIKNELTPNSVMFDIGANIGQHSILMAHYCKEIHAFEPILKLYQQIIQSVKLNGIKNINVHNFGCSDKEEALKIYSKPTNLGNSTFIADANNQEFPSEIAQLKMLDEVMANKPVDLIKIDVEGYEYHALKGAIKILKENKPIIVLEYSPKFYKKLEGNIAQNLYSLLSQEVGYQNIVWLEENKRINHFQDLPQNQGNLLIKP